MDASRAVGGHAIWGAQAAAALPAPVKYSVPAAVGAAVLAVPLTAPILGGIYGISAAGPVAGGAVVAGSSWAVVQSIVMGAALPAIGVVSAGAIGGPVGAALFAASGKSQVAMSHYELLHRPT
ncbi:hypothetical protein B0H16DRAFT_1448520 [Mycena metata]|uniref:Uncharacterized protein n=1 Tax=Mycena metata TaxID=1033252 RepID=A0AAD7K7Z0_9AGAR|nr:hypothetical protein B0H16DRAFT_1448520 [Mycena metata]